MTVLLPKNIDLLDTTALDFDYPTFSASETFSAVPAYRVYNRFIYERLTTGTPSGDEWDETTIYTLGDIVYHTPTTTNYTFLSESLALPSPADDATHYTDLGDYASIGYWVNSGTYTEGDLRAYTYYGVTRYYYCTQTHVVSTYAQNPYTDVYGQWAPVTYWSDATFYLSTADIPYVHDGTNLYQVVVDVVASAPDVDTNNWIASASATPDIDTENWAYVGPANSMRMFDSYSTTQTIGNAGPITVVLQAQEVDGVYLGNILADTVTINVYDAGTEELIEEYEETLQYECENWLEYFSGMWITRLKRSLVYWRTTMTRDVVITVVIDYGSTPAACGVLVVGSAKEIGVSIWGFRRGGMDYTGVSLNPDGSTTAVPGLNVPLIDIDCVVDTDVTDRVAFDLDGLKGVTAVFVGDEQDEYPVTNIFGVLKKHTINGTPINSKASLEINGLA